MGCDLFSERTVQEKVCVQSTTGSRSYIEGRASSAQGRNQSVASPCMSQLRECLCARSRWPCPAEGHSLWRLKDATYDLQRHLPIFLGCSYVTKPNYFGNKIKSINPWFDICSTKCRILIPLTSVSFALEMEMSSMKGECPEIASSSTLFPNLQSSLSFLDLYCIRNPTILFPHLCSISLLKYACTTWLNILHPFNGLGGRYHDYPNFTAERNGTPRSQDTFLSF